jgi:hypothetical protein
LWNILGEKMPAQTADQKPEFAPLWDIPDAWGSAHCPVCGEAILSVVHLPDFPDYFKCANCEVAFDVERCGKLIRLRYIPEELKSLDESLRFAWVDAPSVRRNLPKRVVAKERKETSAVPPPQGLTDEEVLRRAVGMYRLGNAPKFIENSLLHAGASQEQVDAISVRMKRQQEIDARKQSRKFIALAGIAGILVLILGGWLVSSGYFSEEQRAIPTPANFAEQLPIPVQKLLPTTAVNMGGSRTRHDCPVDSVEAAALFGGEPVLWSPAQYGTWQMMSIEISATVFVPAGMRAGYIKNQSLQFSTVNGPAVIYGVNFITIMCE